MTKNDKGMTTTEYLERLATEEKRSRLKAELETNLHKKKMEQRKNQRIKNLIRRVKGLTKSGIEYADQRKLFPDEQESD